MEGIRGPYTGTWLDQARVPFGAQDMDGLDEAWRLALELCATAYQFDGAAWRAAGWADALSVQLAGEGRDRRMQPVKDARGVARRYLEKRVEGAPEPPSPGPQAVEKALLLSHPLPGGRQLIAVSFRGTGGTAREWEPNFACHPVRGVHSGFAQLAGHFAAASGAFPLPEAGHAVGEPALTLAGVEQELCRGDSRFRLLLTGYSQGGAVMQLYARRLLDAGALPRHLLGLGFASPSVSYDPPGAAGFPVFHLANADDLTPRVGALHHLGQVWRFRPQDALRALWYGEALQDAAFRRMLSLSLGLTGLEGAMRYAVLLLRAALGLPKPELRAFFAQLLHPLGDSDTARAVAGQAPLTARVLLFKASSEYRAVFGALPAGDAEELTLLRDMLSMGAGSYAAALWRALALPHQLVRQPGGNPAGYQYIVRHGLHLLTRANGA